MWNVIEAYQAKVINLLRMVKDWEDVLQCSSQSDVISFQKAGILSGIVRKL